MGPGSVQYPVREHDYPVDYVTHDDCLEFCQRVSARTGRAVRLPTEAEFEFALRAGMIARYFEVDSAGLVDLRGWRLWDGTRYTYPVGRLRPNAWGLHDMIGNVSHLTADRARGVTEPLGPGAGGRFIAREGSLTVGTVDHWGMLRGAYLHDERFENLGFRVVLEPADPHVLPAPTRSRRVRTTGRRAAVRTPACG
jgi:formylglycine-generating enzyme required for sulfatase activity